MWGWRVGQLDEGTSQSLELKATNDRADIQTEVIALIGARGHAVLALTKPDVVRYG
jgi:hypothetical protein